MISELIIKIILSIIGVVIPGTLGYFTAKIRSYKEKDKKQKENESLQNIAIKTILKSQLTKTYFVYSKLKKIPDYVYQDFLDMLKVYEEFGGNGFVHTLAKKMEEWDISKTDILK